MRIVDARAEHLPGLLEIYNDVVSNSTAIYSDQPSTLAEREAWWQARVALGYPVLIACDDSGVLGFGSFGDFRSWPGYRFTAEHSVHVRGDRRGQGVGRALLVELVERARQLGKHVLIAGVDAQNEASIRFHERLGFEKAGELREVGVKFGRWLDLVFLQLRLDAAPPPCAPT